MPQCGLFLSQGFIETSSACLSFFVRFVLREVVQSSRTGLLFSACFDTHVPPHLLLPLTHTPADGDVLAIKEHLIDELDYILVPTEGWNKLVSWYGLTDGQEPIARKVWL